MSREKSPAALCVESKNINSGARQWVSKSWIGLVLKQTQGGELRKSARSIEALAHVCNSRPCDGRELLQSEFASFTIRIADPVKAAVAGEYIGFFRSSQSAFGEPTRTGYEKGQEVDIRGRYSNLGVTSHTARDLCSGPWIFGEGLPAIAKR